MVGPCLLRLLVKPQFGNQLVDENHESNSRDEPAQKRSTKNIVQKSESGKPCNQYHSPRHGRSYADNHGICKPVILSSVSLRNTGLDDCAREQRTGRFRANHQ